MRLGLVAYGTATGLGYQTRALHDHLHPDRVLLIDLSHRKHLPPHLDWFPGARVVRDAPTVQDLSVFLDGIDVALCCETPLNYALFAMARQRGVRTVLQYNYEFLDYFREPLLPKPTVFAAPSPWNVHRMDSGRFPVVWELPVPVDPSGIPQRQVTEARTFLHVGGRPAACDRNGTLDFIDLARRCSDLDAEWVVTCQSTTPDIDRALRGSNVTLLTDMPDPGDLYKVGDVMVLPRRFGGLCLAKGTRVTMSDGSRSPIESLVPGDAIRDESGTTIVTGRAERTVDRHVVVKVRGVEVSSSVDHIHLVADRRDGTLEEVKAADVRPGDWMMVVRPDPNGITSVALGERPKIKGLPVNNWPETVVLDDGWARLIGLWIAEGHRGLYSRPGRSRPQAHVVWSFGDKRFAEETVELLAERGIHASMHKNVSPGATYGPSTTWIVRCRTLWLYEMFERLGVGRYSAGKRAPDLDARLAPALIGGWLDGDGNLQDRTTTGYSISTELVMDMWRLCAKAGVLASITHDGRRLDIGGHEQRVTVGSWARRMAPRELVAQGHVNTWAKHESGWMAKVTSVEHVDEPLDVVSIETSTSHYIANDILTHNCMPSREAVTAGMPVIMPRIDPNTSWMPVEWLVPAAVSGAFQAKTRIDLYQTDPGALEALIRRLHSDPHLVQEWAKTARDIATRWTWDALLPAYRTFLDRVMELKP